MLSNSRINSQCLPSSFENEEAFRSATNELYKIFSDTTVDNEQKIKRMLNLSLAYFDFNTAVISSITGSTSVLSSIESVEPLSFPVGSSVPLNRTPDKNTMSTDGHSAKQCCDPGEYEYRSDSNQIPVGSYIATSLHTINGPYGSVSFSSAHARQREFEEFDWKYLTLISNWLGYFLGNAEQIEFMANQNEHYKSLFVSIPAVMFLCDADGLIISASDQFATTIGAVGDMVPGNICLRYFDKEERSSVADAIMQGHAVQLPAKLIQGENKPLEVEINVSVKQLGTMRNIRMVIATDVSARNAALREATEQNRLLEKANEGLNQFAFVASHDLQEPLRKIQQFSSFLEEDLGSELDDDNKYHLNVIVQSSQRMSQLIKDLLVLSKTSSLDPEMSSVCLNKLLASIVDDMEPLLNEAGATIDVRELPTVQGNARLLGQLFTNLLSNGIKYRSSGRCPKLQVGLKEDNGKATINVSDNGIGFDIRNVQKIFEPFHRLHKSADFEGTGIGLAICSAVCQKHGWSIDASSVVGEGSVFSINMEPES